MNLTLNKSLKPINAKNFGASKFWSSFLFVAGFTISSLWVATPAQVNVDEKADRLEALKIELENAKQARDKVIAKRWEDKKQDAEAREKFYQSYDELKTQLETKNAQTERLHEELQNYLKEAEETEAQMENAKAQFSALGVLLTDKTKENSGQLEKSFPVQIPERLARFNQVSKDAENKKDAPAEIVDALVKLQLSEIALTREVQWQRRGFLMADKTPGEGLLLRIGTVASAYRDGKTGRVGLLLKNSSSSLAAPYEWHEDLPVEAISSLANGLQKLENGSNEAVTIPLDILLNQSQGKTYTKAEEKSFAVKIKENIKTGGIFMIPLLGTALAALFLTLRKLWNLSRRRKGSTLVAKAMEELEKNGTKQVIAVCDQQSGNSVLNMIKITAQASGKSRELAEKDLQEYLLSEVPKLEKHLTTLSVLSAAAPLLGLLGTVAGLIRMFESITQHGVNDPKLLAGGIGEALISTETGILIAIPVMLLHNYLANRVDDIVGDMEFYAMKTLNLLWPKG